MLLPIGKKARFDYVKKKERKKEKECPVVLFPCAKRSTTEELHFLQWLLLLPCFSVNTIVYQRLCIFQNELENSIFKSPKPNIKR